MDVFFFIEEDDLLQIYYTIWVKVSADIKKEFDNELFYYKKCVAFFRLCLQCIEIH